MLQSLRRSCVFFFSSRRRHTRSLCDWSSDVCSSDLSVGAEPRAFWGAYGSSKAALETLLGAYADETAFLKRIRVHIVDPGATRTRMRAAAFPGEEPESVKPPEVAAQAIVERLLADAPTGEKVRVEA